MCLEQGLASMMLLDRMHDVEVPRLAILIATVLREEWFPTSCQQILQRCGQFPKYTQKERMQNNFTRSVYSANAQDIYNEANMFLRDQQMKRGGKPRVLGKFDNF